MKVCVAGLGRMGTAVAERLLAAGHEVVVWNRTPGRADELVAGGAREVPLEQIWDEADVCVTMLSDSLALERVCLDEETGLMRQRDAKGKVLIDMSTVSAESSARVAAAATVSGVRYLRAPVSGNPAVVRAGGLAIVVSGSSEDFADAKPFLSDIGPHVFYAGNGESARVIKLALNLMVAGTTELLAECVALAEGHGVDRAILLEIVGASAVGSPFVKYKTGPLLADDYDSTFTTRLMKKDLDLALASGGEAGVPLPVTAVVHQLLQACISTGLGDLDFMSLLIRLQREAGLQSVDLSADSL